MLTMEEIRHKAQAMQRLAVKAAPSDAVAYRDLAMQWRLLEIEAVFMDAMRPSTGPEYLPPATRG